MESSGNYWDLAGERMLVMGVDSGGITEIWAHPVMSLRDFNVSYSLKVEDLRLKVEDLDDEAVGPLETQIQVLPSVI